MKKCKKCALIAVICVIVGIGILIFSVVKMEKTGIDGIYFGMPGFLIEWKEGEPNTVKKQENGEVFRTYNDVEFFDNIGDVTYCNLMGLNEVRISYKNADDELYQKISDELLDSYQDRKDFYMEGEIVGEKSASIEFGTEHGANGIKVEIRLVGERLEVSMNSMY